MAYGLNYAADHVIYVILRKTLKLKTCKPLILLGLFKPHNYTPTKTKRLTRQGGAFCYRLQFGSL